MPPLRQLAYSLQWASFGLGIVLVTTTIVGPGIGLTKLETAEFGSRVMIVTGLATLLQSRLGHGYPIIEGPGAIYWALYLFTFSHPRAGTATLPEIEGGMLVAGAAVALFALSGLARKWARLFSPLLSGTTLTLISLSFVADSAARFGGVSATYPQGNPVYLGAVVGVVLTGVLISLLGRGDLGNLPILLTAILGYAAFALFKQVDFSVVGQARVFALPRILAWGPPTFRPELALAYAIAGLLATVNTFAAVESAAAVLGQQDTDLRPRHRAGILFNGVAQLLAGFGAAAGTASLASSTSIVSLSRSGSRRTVVLASLALIGLGLFPVVSALLSSVPAPVVNGLFFLVVANLFTLGLDQFRRIQFDTRSRWIVGISILSGLAVTYVPGHLLESIPFGGSLLLGNPIIVGTAVAFLGEHVIFGAWLRRLMPE